MPSWLVPVLQWGGLALAIISAAALFYVLGIMEPAAEGEQITAPVPVYWVLLVIGVVGAVVGFVLARRKPTGIEQS